MNNFITRMRDQSEPLAAIDDHIMQTFSKPVQRIKRHRAILIKHCYAQQSNDQALNKCLASANQVRLQLQFLEGLKQSFVDCVREDKTGCADKFRRELESQLRGEIEGVARKHKLNVYSDE